MVHSVTYGGQEEGFSARYAHFVREIAIRGGREAGTSAYYAHFVREIAIRGGREAGTSAYYAHFVRYKCFLFCDIDF